MAHWGNLNGFLFRKTAQEAFSNRIWFTALVQEGFRPTFLASKINAFLCDRSLVGQVFVRDRT
jgi:hypothetical protein